MTEVNHSFVQLSSSPSVVTPPDQEICLGMWHILIALILVLMTITTVFGNTLVIMSILLYKRMRTFTNILLMSLASSDLLVGLVVMPMALVDLLHGHQWPFGRFMCGVWATSDVLLCTASILNLCVISLDRYMAITSPLKYTRTRSRTLAGGLLGVVWVLSVIVCSPPWFVPNWNLFKKHDSKLINATEYVPLFCAYSPSLPYRIYSAMGSFYIPLFVMLFVYTKIFRVANERELLLSKTSTVRFSQKVTKAPPSRNASTLALYPAVTESKTRATSPGGGVRKYISKAAPHLAREESFSSPKSSFAADEFDEVVIKRPPKRIPIEREFHSMIELEDDVIRKPPLKPARKVTELTNDVPLLEETARELYLKKTVPEHLCSKASEYYANSKPVRGSREKMVYMRERKALKTIGIVVSGFIICWLPFFLLYLLEVMAELPQGIGIVSDVFLWLGYSNSVLNPIIYTMYNGDFRRCFKDLLRCGCCKTHRRSMSVRRLQQSTMF